MVRPQRWTSRCLHQRNGHSLLCRTFALPIRKCPILQYFTHDFGFLLSSFRALPLPLQALLPLLHRVSRLYL